MGLQGSLHQTCIGRPLSGKALQLLGLLLSAPADWQLALCLVLPLLRWMVGLLYCCAAAWTSFDVTLLAALGPSVPCRCFRV